MATSDTLQPPQLNADGEPQVNAGIPSWIDDPTSWDKLIVAGQKMPGIARVIAGGRKYKLDSKKTQGADGATLTGLGHMPGEFTITLRFWVGAQFALWLQVQQTLQPPPYKGQPVALDVFHPQLAALGVKSLYFTDISPPMPVGAGGDEYLVTLKTTEWLPVKSGKTVTKTVSASANFSSVPNKVVPGPTSAASTSPATDPAAVGP